MHLVAQYKPLTLMSMVICRYKLETIQDNQTAFCTGKLSTNRVEDTVDGTLKEISQVKDRTEYHFRYGWIYYIKLYHWRPQEFIHLHCK